MHRADQQHLYRFSLSHIQNWLDNNSGADKLKFIFPIEIKWGIKELYNNQVDTTALQKLEQKVVHSETVRKKSAVLNIAALL